MVADPLFADGASGNYRLKAGSPCIDAGWRPWVEGETDVDGMPRWQGGGIDLGAYEALGSDWVSEERGPAVWFVSASNGNDANMGSSWEEAKATIQAAIEQTLDGDEIRVADGVYAPIAALDARIRIVSEGGAEHASINGGGVARCATLGETTNTVLDGFCLTNGVADSGGGAYNGTLINCIVSGNSAKSYGGGAYYTALNHCTLSGNEANWGGGGGAYGRTLNRCILRGNEARWGGGAAQSTLNNCLVIGNTASSLGGGTHNGTLNNCTLSGNRASEYAGGAHGGTLNNCIVFGNSASQSNAVHGATCRYTCLDEEVEGKGNIFADPHFVDAANGNYRLAADSPCRGAGSKVHAAGETDLDGNPRIMGRFIDMGAYEFVEETPEPPSLAEALDCPALAFATGGDAEWVGQWEKTHDGEDAARSGTISDNQSTWLETTVAGPGTLSFWWTVSSESAMYDYLEFLVDGVQDSRIGGTTAEWTQKNVELPTGTHVLRWTYLKDDSYGSGEDCGWVDQIVWTPTGTGTIPSLATNAAAEAAATNPFENSLLFMPFIVSPYSSENLPSHCA